MMNFLALGLVLTSLATAGFFTPTPQNPKSKEEDVIVKEGHRVVVVEYEKEDGNSKVLISPQEKAFDNDEKMSENLEEKVKKMGDLFGSSQENGNSERKFRPRELVCDVYGKCRHKMASTFKKTAETANGVKEKFLEGKEKVEEVVEGAAEKVKEKFLEGKEKKEGAAEGAKEKLLEGKEKVEGAKEAAKEKLLEGREKVNWVKDAAEKKVKEKFLESKEKVEGGAEGAKEKFLEGKEKVEGAKDVAAKKVKEKLLEGKEKVNWAKDVTAEKVKEKVLEGKEKAEKVKEKFLEGKEKVEGAKEAAANKGKEKFLEVKEKAKGGKGLREILRRAGEVAGVVHLMGFAAAYGMGVWVTFASSYVLEGALPRQQLAVVQSKMYPVYFKAMGCGVAMALFGHLMGRQREAGAVGVLQGVNLAAAMGMILVNLMWLEPQATKVCYII